MFVVTSRSDPSSGRVPAAPMQRARGKLRARFVSVDGNSRLSDLHESGSAKLRLPRAHSGAAEPILINTAGGLAGGDHFELELEASDAAKIVATTQASEKIYRSLGDAALVETRLSVGAEARLDWLPQETILFDRARLQRSFDVDLDERAEFLAVEAVILGRRATGETVREGVLRDRWRIRKGDRLVFADDIRLDGALDEVVARPAALAGAGAMATLIYIGEDCERRLDQVRAVLGEQAGASAFDGKLIARLVAADGYQLRRMLIPVIAALRHDEPLPKTWQQ
jgi:urease accessory protein